MEERQTLILGASLNPSRYSYKAIHSLVKNQEKVIAVGLKEGEVAGISILKTIPDVPIHTVSLYLGSERQEVYYSKIVEINPKRVIFNPGTENPALFSLLEKNNIEYIEACTLVMLSIGNY